MSKSSFYNNRRRADGFGESGPRQPLTPKTQQPPRNRQAQTSSAMGGQRLGGQQTAGSYYDQYANSVMPVFHPKNTVPAIIELPDEEMQDMNLNDSALAKFREENPKEGFLKLQVSTASRAVPIYEAMIHVYLDFDDNRYMVASETTDLSGLTIPIALPAPDKQLTLDPSNPRPYASYDVLVEHPDYKKVELKAIPIFDGVTSVQQVNMVPEQAEPEIAPSLALNGQNKTAGGWNSRRPMRF